MKLLHNTNFMHFLYEIYVTALRAPLDNRFSTRSVCEETPLRSLMNIIDSKLSDYFCLSVCFNRHI